MDEMMLKCPVTIKSKVTEALKKQLATDIQNAIRKVDLELQQIDFQAKRLMTEQARQDPEGSMAIRQQINAERQKRIDYKNQLQERLQASTQLELGAEIVQGTLERMITLHVGDNLQKEMGAEILLEDGKVIAFRI